MVPYGQSVEAVDEKGQCLNPLTFAKKLTCCINRVFDEYVNEVVEGKYSIEQYLHE